MNAELLFLGAAPFEAAVRVPVLPQGHRARRLHGHSYVARAAVPAGAAGDTLAAQLAAAVAPLDYSLLNDTLEIPSDENLARWIRARLAALAPHSVGVQSTRHSGADLDPRDRAHLWRRYRFEAAHRLPHVRAGHPCGRMHGHGFEVVLHVEQDLGARDIGIEFERIDALWAPLAARLDRACLNDVRGLENPTSELLARWILERLRPELPELSWVSVFETTTAGCHYDGAQFRIWKETRFESALALPDGGRNGALHGHSYLARLHLAAPLDAVLGWTIDFGDVREAFTPVYRRIDHQRLDETTVGTPDLAALLGWLRDACAPQLPALVRIDLFETPSRGATLAWGTPGPALPGLLP